jgi:hypothetical protein
MLTKKEEVRRKKEEVESINKNFSSEFRASVKTNNYT